MASFVDFCHSLETFDLEGAGSEIHVVIGNESGDLDSVACALVCAYILSKSADTPVVPCVAGSSQLIQRDAIFLLDQIGIGRSCVRSLGEIPINQFENVKVTLVDHHTLDTPLQVDNCQLVQVIDHHSNPPEYPPGTETVITSVGSCSSLLVGQYKEEVEFDDAMATLLLGAILVDTLNLKSERSTEVDASAVKDLSEISGADRADLFASVMQQRFGRHGDDIAVLLRRDLKQEVWNKFRILFSTVTCDFKELVYEEDFVGHLEVLLGQEGGAMAVILFASLDKDGSVDRSIALYQPPSTRETARDIAETAAAYLEYKCEAIRIGESPDDIIILSTQSGYTRKLVLPLVMESLERPTDEGPNLDSYAIVSLSQFGRTPQDEEPQGQEEEPQGQEEEEEKPQGQDEQPQGQDEEPQGQDEEPQGQDEEPQGQDEEEEEPQGQDEEEEEPQGQDEEEEEPQGQDEEEEEPQGQDEEEEELQGQDEEALAQQKGLPLDEHDPVDSFVLLSMNQKEHQKEEVSTKQEEEVIREEDPLQQEVVQTKEAHSQETVSDIISVEEVHPNLDIQDVRDKPTGQEDVTPTLTPTMSPQPPATIPIQYTPPPLEPSVTVLATPEESSSIKFEPRPSEHGGPPPPIPELDVKEELHETRDFRIVNVGGEEIRVDLKQLEDYRPIVAHAGYMGKGSTAVVVVQSRYLPPRSLPNYNQILTQLFYYVLSTVDNIVVDDYVLVYIHGDAPRNSMPGFNWFRRFYQMIDRRLRKNLRHLYLVNPSIWIRLMQQLARPFISAKFYRKIVHVSGMEELPNHIPISNLEGLFPQFRQTTEKKAASETGKQEAELTAATDPKEQ